MAATAQVDLGTQGELELGEQQPRWSRDLVRFLPLKSQFLLSGNVRDRYPLQMEQGRARPLALQNYLAELLRSAGIAHVLAFDPVNGFSLPLSDGLGVCCP